MKTIFIMYPGGSSGYLYDLDDTAAEEFKECLKSKLTYEHVNSYGTTVINTENICQIEISESEL